MPRARLIALDLDGTLLNSERQLSEVNIEALQAAQAAGIHVVLASGRAFMTMLPFADQAGLQGPLVCCNGAFTVDSQREEITHHALGTHALGLILDYAQGKGLHTNLYERRQVFFSGLGPEAELYSRRTGVAPLVADWQELRAKTPTKALFVGRPDEISKAADELQQTEIAELTTIVRSEADYVEFLPAGINKGIGVAEVAASLGIPREDCAALGDYWNDLEMVQWAGIGGAVANAVDGVKAAASIHVAHHDQNGAAEFIRQLL